MKVCLFHWLTWEACVNTWYSHSLIKYSFSKTCCIFLLKMFLSHINILIKKCADRPSVNEIYEQVLRLLYHNKNSWYLFISSKGRFPLSAHSQRPKRSIVFETKGAFGRCNFNFHWGERFPSPSRNKQNGSSSQDVNK